MRIDNKKAPNKPQRFYVHQWCLLLTISQPLTKFYIIYDTTLSSHWQHFSAIHVLTAIHIIWKSTESQDQNTDKEEAEKKKHW